ncbi:hypothetical protein E2P86_13345 [Sphingobacterium psychroaquaticum]|uniref:hypothetical protein n=1 Tax=Sphingobacterium psychroaquaticum TaxID=561061 RepID=UPI0010696A6C|nr:hypothetical protein [Sphingobacterium psychroaquaticum]QBQ42081.1 hypothetical protein E2P86_13345 [Sphingobacterium psychroaquaticum]
MKNIYNHLFSVLAAGLLFSSLFLASCNKTNYDYEQKPYKEILSFKIATVSHGTDSVNAVISGDSISIYWDPSVPLPATITPTIHVANGATVQPASGVAVPFSDKTIYNVTAEDGSVKAFRLKPVYNLPVPTVSEIKTVNRTVAWGHALLNSYQSLRAPNVTGHHFFRGTDQTTETIEMQHLTSEKVVSWPLETFVPRHMINIIGEYFLSAQRDPSDFRVFIKRLSDGFEVECDIESITENKIIAAFPKYTSEQQSGAHQLIMKVSGRTYEGDKIDIGPPPPGYLKGDFKFDQMGQKLNVGDEITLNFTNIHDNYDGKIVALYQLKNITSVEYVFHRTGSTATSYLNIQAKDLTITENQVKHKVIAALLQAQGVQLKTISFVYAYKDQRVTTGYAVAKKVFAMPLGTYITRADVN